MQYSIFFASVCLSAFSMPLIMGYAHKKELYDTAGGRKIHSGNIPRLGGVGMFWAFVLVLFFFTSAGHSPVQAELVQRLGRLLPLGIGAALLHFIGLIDDFKPQPARLKLGIQVIAAGIVVGSGFGFQGFGFQTDILSGSLSWLAVIISLGWLVGVPNAVNMIDGLDGLAGGGGFIVSLAYAFFYYNQRDMASAFLCLSLAGVIMGFLFVNFPAPKAKMFMGDSGSLFLGFSLAVMPFLGQTAQSPAVKQIGLVPAILLMFVPVYDTLRAILRRLIAGRDIMSPDRLHIHHLFFDNGYRTITILGLLHGATVLQVIVVFIAMSMPRSLGYMLEAISCGAVALLFRYARSLQLVEREQ